MKFLSAPVIPLALAVHSYAACQKYVDPAKNAAKNLQSKYFVDGTYGDQAVWISAVDTFYLQQRAFSGALFPRVRKLITTFLELTVDAVSGTKEYATVIDSVYRGQEDYLDNGGSYDDVQWVVMSYLMAGNAERAKHYYDIASSALEDKYCGGGRKSSKP